MRWIFFLVSLFFPCIEVYYGVCLFLVYTFRLTGVADVLYFHLTVTHYLFLQRRTKTPKSSVSCIPDFLFTRVLPPRFFAY